MAAITRSTSGYGVQSGQNGSIIQFGEGVYNFSDTPKLIVPGCIVQGCGGSYSGARTLLSVPVGKQGFIVGDTNQDGGTGTGSYLRDFGLTGNGYLVGGTQSNDNVNGWQATHAYLVGDVIQPAYSVNNGSKWGGYLWRCTVAGTSSGSEPAWPIANTLSTFTESNPTQSDGGVTWQAVQAHGLVIHGSVHCQNISVSAFAGDGFHNYGDTTNSNTDLSTFINCNAFSNFGSGFWTAGNDSAPSTFLQCNALLNYGYGFYDFSLEGNIYEDCHTRNNGSEAWLPTNSPTLNTFMSPTVPNDYLYMVTIAGGATGSSEPSWPTSIGATVANGSVTFTCERHYSGGPYYMRNSGLLACYSEGGQQPSILSTVSAWSKGGSHGAGFLVDPTQAMGRIETTRFDNSSFATLSENGDGFPIKTWMGARNSSKLGWSVAKLSSGSPVSNTDLDLAFSTGNTTTNGWRFQLSAGAHVAANIADGTESGTTAGDWQFPGGFWVGGPQSPGGGNHFTTSANSQTFPSPSGQIGDIQLSTAGNAGIATWHNIGSSADDGAVARWCIGTEAGAFHPIDVSATSVGSPYVMTRGDHNAVVHNRGASVKSGVTLRFADEYPYARQKFISAAASGMRIVSQHGSKIMWDAVDSGDAGYIETTTVNATLTLESISGIYVVVAATGIWNFNGVAIVQPGVESLLSSTVVDLSLSTKQNLYTVPSGQNLIVTKVIARSPSSTITTATGGVGFNAGATDVLTSVPFPVASTTYSVSLAATGTVPAIGAAAAVLGFKTTATQAATTMTVEIFGYFY